MHVLHAATQKYLEDLRKQHAEAVSTDELSYRIALSNFLEGATQVLGRQAIFTNEAKLTKFGRPDYVVTHGLKQIGGVEAEAWGADLTHLTGSAKTQNERFRDNLPNFLQTNHFHFRLFVAKNLVAEARLPEPAATGKITLSDAVLDDLQAVLERFLDAALPAAASAEAIAAQLAKRAVFLKAAASEMLTDTNSALEPLYALYKETLFADIDRQKFADVYAQTFTYGLFLAWLSADKKPFDRAAALSAIPKAVPPIRVMLQFGGGADLPPEFCWIVDGICDDLDNADKEAATRPKVGIADPLVAFYETFLQAYDPALRERAGVYYTPDAVVDFLVRAVDGLLQTHFGKPEGLADDSVRLLDPATGTATFLARAYRQVHQTMMEGGDAGLWPDKAKDHVAKHFYGFERLPTAYTLAHVKLRQQMEILGVTLGSGEGERLPVYLADTMMNHVPEQGALPGQNILSKEIRDAAEVRNAEPILVVLGNPPYNAKSDNPSKDSKGKFTFIGNLVEDYYYMDGQRIKERNSKGLQDDYVKFLRFAQWRIEQTGQGIVAFITNNSYFTEPTYAAMRYSLIQTFDEIYILDLHGNSTKRERSPDGTEDKNVFDIMQGVGIAICMRHEGIGKRSAIMRHADLYGKRKDKYDTLLQMSLQDIGQKITPIPPSYRFQSGGQFLSVDYPSWWSIQSVFGEPTTGFKTHRDHFAVAFDKATLEARIEDLRGNLSDEQIRIRYAKRNAAGKEEDPLPNSPDWTLAKARATLRSIEHWQDFVTPCVYRPFDDRYCYLNETIMTRPRPELIQHALKPNLLLVTSRQGGATGDLEWQTVFATRRPADTNLFRRGGNIIYPLWDYPTEKEAALGIEKQANIAPAFMKAVQDKVGQVPTPEDIFHYAYAVFHAPTYRTRYAAFLKTDFPRLPLPPNADTFQTLAALGAKLVALHLLEAPELAQHGIGFPIPGDHTVLKMKDATRYLPPADGKPGRVKLNATEYFDNVPPEAWEFQVGGYRPASKWLADREGRSLTIDDIAHYRRTLAALRDTAALLPSVDTAFVAAFPIIPN